MASPALTARLPFTDFKGSPLRAAFSSSLHPRFKLSSCTVSVPLKTISICCRATFQTDKPVRTPKPSRLGLSAPPRTPNPLWIRPALRFTKPRPSAGFRKKQKSAREQLLDVSGQPFESSLSSVPSIGWITPVSMPRKKGLSVPERWPNEEEMQQHGWDTGPTGHPSSEPSTSGKVHRSTPMLHGRGMNTPKIRVRPTASVTQGFSKPVGVVRFHEGGDIAEDVIGALRRLAPTPEVVKEVMISCGDHVSKSDVIAVVTALQKRHDWRRAFYMFSWMKKQSWHRPNLRFYTGMMNFLGKHGQAELVTLLFQELLLEKLRPDNYTFTALINCYGRVQLFEEAMAVFNHMKTETPACRPNTVTCNALIGALCRGGEYARARAIFTDMEAGVNGLEGCSPNGVTSNIMISALCKAGRIEEAEAVLRNMESAGKCAPDVITYNTLMDACAKNGMTGKAAALFAELRGRQLAPDVITYTAMIDAYGKEGLCDESERVFREMETAGCRADSWAYTALIDAYGKGGRPELAEETFHTMTSHRVEPTEVTFLALIDAFAKAGRHAEAGAWFTRLKKAGFKPTTLHYSALMDGYGRGGRVKEAANLFREMQKAGCAPSTVTYSALLTACSKCNTWEEALVLLYSLSESGREEELAMCRLVMGSPGEAGLWENANRVFRKVAGENRAVRRSFFNALLDVLWAFGLRARADRVLTTARQTGAYSEADICSFTDARWELDLHTMGVGAAQTMVLQWLGEIRTALAWGATIPSEVTVVTGWGKHTRAGASTVKSAVRQLLEDIGAPVVAVAGNGGRVTFTGAELLTWLRSGEGRERVTMRDVMRPGPAEERRRERRELRFAVRR